MAHWSRRSSDTLQPWVETFVNHNLKQHAYNNLSNTLPAVGWVPIQRGQDTSFQQSPLCLPRLPTHEIPSERQGLVSSYPPNVFWLLIYLISFNRSVIEIHQKFLSVNSPLMSVGFQHLLRLHYRGSSLGSSHTTEWQSISHWDNQAQDAVCR